MSPHRVYVTVGHDCTRFVHSKTLHRCNPIVFCPEDFAGEQLRLFFVSRRIRPNRLVRRVRHESVGHQNERMVARVFDGNTTTSLSLQEFLHTTVTFFFFYLLIFHRLVRRDWSPDWASPCRRAPTWARSATITWRGSGSMPSAESCRSPATIRRRWPAFA